MTKMATTTLTTSSTGIAASAGLAVLIGMVLIVLAGHVQADALHAAAHDVRHATGFPCH
jgi:cobalt transporter subunit CbtB